MHKGRSGCCRCDAVPTWFTLRLCGVGMDAVCSALLYCGANLLLTCGLSCLCALLYCCPVLPQYMHYSNTALMAQSLAEGSSRRPALPTTEEDADDVAGQQGSNAADASAPAAGAGAAAGNSSALSTGSSTGTGRRSSQLQSREYVVIVPGAAGDTSSSATPATAGGVIASSATATSSGSRRTPAASQGGLEAQQLAQRVLDRLKKEEQGSTAGRGSWPGGEAGSDSRWKAA